MMETGAPFAGRTIDLSPSWLSEDFLPSFTGGVGVGYVWGPAFRTDFTVVVIEGWKPKPAAKSARKYHSGS
jgi:hypothetical protein